MKEIPLTQGRVTMVDDEDYEYLTQWRWYYHSGYAVRTVEKNGIQETIRLHREILKTPDGMHGDHINGDKLDNRRMNLRNCTWSDNLKNRKVNKNSTSGFKGVYFHKQTGKWRARIRSNLKHISLGLFDNPVDAALAYDEAARFYHGEFARTNF